MYYGNVVPSDVVFEIEIYSIPFPVHRLPHFLNFETEYVLQFQP